MPQDFAQGPAIFWVLACLQISLCTSPGMRSREQALYTITLIAHRHCACLALFVWQVGLPFLGANWDLGQCRRPSSLWRCVSLTHSLSVTLTHSLSLTLTHSFYLTLSLSRARALSLSHSFSHTHTHTFSFVVTNHSFPSSAAAASTWHLHSLPPSLSLSLSLSL